MQPTTHSARLPSALLLTCMAMAFGCAESPPVEQPLAADTESAAALSVEERLAQFAPTVLEADLSGVPESEREVLAALIHAARLMDEIFLRQVWEGNPELRHHLFSDAQIDDAVRQYYEVNFGPWDRLAEMEAFIEGVPVHPPGAGYYPTDLTAEEFESYLEQNPEQRPSLVSLFTVVRRAGEDGKELLAQPYSQVYEQWLAPAAEHLRRAAGATQNTTLRRYLTSRADAFASDEYYESDLAWMDLDAPVEVTIGPYEVYEDGLFGYKAAFEGFVTVDLPTESAALERYKALLPSLERSLPIADQHKNLDRGTESPIRVVDVVFVGGDSKAGVQTTAFNLPNDERVREEKGSKKVLLRNVMRAKYDKVLVPIAQRTLSSDQIDEVAFEAFFAFTLHHELAHGLGPGKITIDGRATEVRLELRDLYSTLEEAKADVMGVYNILQLIRRGEIDATLRATLEPTYVAGLFRSARFGLHEAHGRGVVSQFNYLLEQGALVVDEDGRFRIDEELFPSGIEQLLREMLMLQANGDYAGTAAFLDRYGIATSALEAAIARLADVPVDIRPIYEQAQELAPPQE